MEVASSNYLCCTVRVPRGVLAKIDEHFRHGCAINRTDFIRRAIYQELRRGDIC